MNGFKTLMLLAAMTALFMGLGYTFGGTGGAPSAAARSERPARRHSACS